MVYPYLLPYTITLTYTSQVDCHQRHSISRRPRLQRLPPPQHGPPRPLQHRPTHHHRRLVGLSPPPSLNLQLTSQVHLRHLPHRPLRNSSRPSNLRPRRRRLHLVPSLLLRPLRRHPLLHRRRPHERHLLGRLRRPLQQKLRPHLQPAHADAPNHPVPHVPPHRRLNLLTCRGMEIP